MNMNYTEAVRLARAGEEQGFAYLYENTYKSKYYLALQYMKNQDVAEDVLQEAYMRAFSKLDTLQEPENFPAWLGQIVANTAKNALVKKNPILFSDVAEQTDIEDYAENIEAEDIDSQPELSYTRDETKLLVHELIDSLSEEQRMCILMFHIEDIPIKDIAQTLGCSENTVKSRLNYGRKNLRIKAEELQKKGYKLYGFAPLPLLLLLLRTEEGNMLTGGSIQKCGQKIEQSVFSQLYQSGHISDGNKTATDTRSREKSGTSANRKASSAGKETGKAAAKSAAKTGFLATTAGKVTVAVLSICVAGGVLFGISQIARKNNTDDKKTTLAENKKKNIENKKTQNESKKKNTENKTVAVNNSDYPELIEGALTKEELEYVLANGPEQLTEDGLSDSEYPIILNDLCSSDTTGKYITFAGKDANYRYGYNAKEVNRFFLVFTDYQFTEDNDSDSDYGIDVKDDTIWFSPSTPGYELSASIKEASVTDDTMQLHYTYVRDSYENGKTTTDKLATLKRSDDGKFKIVTITDDNQATDTTGSGTSDVSGDAADTTSVKSLYQNVLKSIQNKESGYEFTLSGGSSDYEYFVYDMNGDGIKELFVGTSFTEDVFNAYDVRVFTINQDTSEAEIKALSDEFATVMLYIPSDGNGLYSSDGMSRGTGKTEICRVTMNGDTITKGSTPELTFTMGDGTDDTFYASNQAVQWKSISDLSGLDD